MSEAKVSLISEFRENAEKSAASTYLVQRSSSSLVNAIQNITAPEENILFAQPQSLDLNLFVDLLQLSNIITELNESLFTKGSVGITDAFAGVAHTGSVCVTLTNREISLISMLSSKHIVIIDSNTITKLPRNILLNEEFSTEVAADSFTYITGPSATADMGPLVRGVHGPGELEIIIFE